MNAETLTRQDAIRYWNLELWMIQHTVNGLFKLMEPHFSGFPDNYLVIDVETTGVGKEDLIAQPGYCLVENGKVVSNECFMLDWTSMPGKFPHDKLRARLEQTKQKVEWKDGVPTGKTYHITFERMRDEGIDPIAGLECFYDLITSMRERRFFIVAHNGYFFDARFFQDHFGYFLKKDFVFGDYEIFDTGMVEKGAQINSIPWIGETVKDWSRRTSSERIRHVKWALDISCVPRYQLDEQYNLNMDEAHDAGFDCYVTHLLFEEYKKIAAGKKPEPPPGYRTDRGGRGPGAPTPLP